MKGILRRLFPAPGEPDPDPDPDSAAGPYREHVPTRRAPSPPRAVSIDGNTRTFWARGEALATTIIDVETDGIGTRSRRRRMALPGLTADNGGGVATRPRGNPAFTETLFIELMRARQFARAYGHLSPECQRLWGSVQHFAAAQGGGGWQFVQGVTVREVRYLDEWTDPDTGTAHRHVAELVVEYTVGSDSAGNVRPPTRLERTVHLIPFEGRWRSLCAPLEPSVAFRPPG